MVEAFAWIGKIAESILSTIPQRVLLNSTEGAVKYQTVRIRDLARLRWDTSIKPTVLQPGMHWFWPAVSEIQSYVVARQAFNLPTQTLTTKDGKVIAVGAVMVFRIVDVFSIITRTFDPDVTIRSVAMGAIQQLCCPSDWDELQMANHNGTLNRELRRTLQLKLGRRFGIKVLDASFTDLAPCRVLKVVQAMSTD